MDTRANVHSSADVHAAADFYGTGDTHAVEPANRAANADICAYLYAWRPVGYSGATYPGPDNTADRDESGYSRSRYVCGDGFILIMFPPTENFYLSAANSSSVSLMVAAAAFSSRCSTDDVPGIGSMAGDRFSSHASAICGGVAL